MAANNEIGIKITADASQLTGQANQASDAIDKIGTRAKKSAGEAAKNFAQLTSALKDVPKAFDEVAAGAAALERIHKSIDIAATAAINAGKPLAELGKAPLQDLRKLDAELNTIRRVLASGFTPAINNIKLLPTTFDRAGNSISKTSNSLGRLQKDSNASFLALNDMGRVIQDLPFGLLGIANNITPMLESFRRLRAESGSTKTALLSLVGSLGGFGGLVFAISALTSIIQIAQFGIMSFGRKTKDATDKAKEFLDTIRSASDVKFAGESNVAGQIILVQQLAAAVRDETLSQKERLNALNQLKQANKEYFGDLSLQKTALAQLPKLVDDYTAALITNAIVQESKSEIGKIGAEYFKQKKILDQLVKSRDAYLEQFDEERKNSLKKGQNFIVLTPELKAINVQIDKQRQVVAPLADKYADLAKNIRDFSAQTLKQKPLVDAGETKKEVDLIKQRISALKELIQAGVDVKQNSLELKGLEIKLLRRDGKKDGLTEEEIEKLIFAQFPDFKGGIKLSKPIVLTVPLTIVPDVQKTISDTDPAGDNLIEAITRTQAKLVKAGQDAGNKLRTELAKPLDEVSRSIQRSLVNVFQGIGEGIGDVLAGANPIQTFVSVIADALEQLGKALIAFGIAKKFAIDSLKTLNPFVAIGAGIAAIAAGKLLKSQLAKTPKFAQGGLVTGPTLATVGDAGPELIVPFNRVNQYMNGDPYGGTVVFQIAGTTLQGVLRRADQSGLRRGGV